LPVAWFGAESLLSLNTVFLFSYTRQQSGRRRLFELVECQAPIVVVCSPLGRDANGLLLREDELLGPRQPDCRQHDRALSLCYDLAMALLRTDCIDEGAMQWPWN
jgi:hypothetical protein